MAANVQIDIKATDKASPAINSVNKSVSSMAKNAKEASLKFTEFNSMMQIATQVIRVAGQAYNMTVGEAQKYNLAMVDMARKMGTTTEEASRLVQVGDDVRLSQEQISTAMTYAIRNGIQPNIDGLANLADEYTRLSTPVEKGQLLLKSFGRSGMEMGKLLEKGGQGIRDMSAAIEDGLIVTEEGAKASQRYYEALDRLEDSSKAVFLEIGNTGIPLLANAAEGFMNLKQATDEATFSLNPFSTLIRANKIGLDNYAISLGNSVTETGFLKNATDGLNPSLETEYDALVAASGATSKLTTEFIFNKAASALDAEAALNLAYDLGILDKNSADASAAMDALNDLYRSGKITSKEYSDMVKGLNQQLKSLEDKNGLTIQMYVDVWYRSHGIVPSGQTNSTYQASGVPGTTAVPRAAGGPASGMTWVGENGPELVNLPGGSRVTSNKESMSMGFDYNKLERTLVRVFRDAGQKA